MSLKVKHAFVSGKPAVGGSDKVQGTHWDADHIIEDSALPGQPAVGTLVPVGTIVDYAGIGAPSGWLECAGQLLSGATYPALYSALVKFGSSISITVGTPAVISWAGHYLIPGSKVWFGVTSGGTLPAGMSAGSHYYVISAGWAEGSFRISSTFEGAAVNTTAPGTGTPYAVHAPFGAAGTDFNLPDLREVVTAGHSNSGWVGSGTRFAGNYGVGDVTGAETKQLAVGNMPRHDHNGVTGTESAYHTHAITGTGSGSGTTDLQGVHSHTFSGDTANNSRGDGGLDRVQRLQSGNAGDSDHATTSNGGHQHNFSVDVSLSGSTGVESVGHTHGIALEGANLPFSVVQPTMFIRKIIYTGV